MPKIPTLIKEEKIEAEDNSVYSPVCPRGGKHRWIVDDDGVFCKNCLEPSPREYNKRRSEK